MLLRWSCVCMQQSDFKHFAHSIESVFKSLTVPGRVRSCTSRKSAPSCVVLVAAATARTRLIAVPFGAPLKIGYRPNAITVPNMGRRKQRASRLDRHAAVGAVLYFA
jgi:hypothetical protein